MNQEYKTFWWHKKIDNEAKAVIVARGFRWCTHAVNESYLTFKLKKKMKAKLIVC